MPNDERNLKPEVPPPGSRHFGFGILSFFRHLAFVIRHFSHFPWGTALHLICRNADVVCHAAIPSGSDISISPARTDTLRSFVSTSTSLSLSIHAWIFASVIRSRMRYQCPVSKPINFVVSFSEASIPSRLEIPTKVPPQPPTMRLQKFVPTGTVRPQKKSEPLIRMASSAIS